MSYNQLPNEASTTQKQAKGTEDIVRQHLADPNHIITEEDIKSVVIGNFEDAQDYKGALLQKDTEVSDEDGVTDEQKPATPWTV